MKAILPAPSQHHLSVLVWQEKLESSLSSLTQSCPTLYDPMDCSTPGLPVHHQLPELAETHVHLIDDAIQPSYPLLSSSPPAFNLPSIGVFSNESALHIRQPKYWSFSFSISSSNEYLGLISFRMDWLQVGSPCSPRDSQESSPTPQFKSINSSTLSFLHSPTLTSIHDHRKNHSVDEMDLCWQSKVSAFEYTIQVGHNFSSKG